MSEVCSRVLFRRHRALPILDRCGLLHEISHARVYRLTFWKSRNSDYGARGSELAKFSDPFLSMIVFLWGFKSKREQGVVFI